MEVKKLVCVIVGIALILAAVCFVGCSDEGMSDGRISIVCSVFPEYDWVRNIVGNSDNVSVELLIKNGQELHSYEASPADIVKLKQSDMVVSMGAYSDSWISEALDQDADGVRHLKLMELPNIVKYPVCSENSEHDHLQSDHSQHDHSQTDEHLWLSLKNASYICRVIEEELCSIDPSNAPKYRENTRKYIERLSELDARMQSIPKENTLLFADRFPFVYLLEDYGFNYISAFEGCSSDIVWDLATTIRLADKLDALSKKYIFVTETSDGRLAESVIENSKGGVGEILILESMQSISGADAESKEYIEIMSYNISVLESAFVK